MALNKTLSFDLELKPGGIPPIIHASQGDIGRMFKANIYWDGAAATSYVSGATVNLRGKKPDKTVFDYTATLAGSMVTFETTEQMTIISGPVECELVFSNDGDIIASANFLLIVEASPYNPDNLSESDVDTLGELVSDQIPPAVGDWLEDNVGVAPTKTVINDAVSEWLDDNGTPYSSFSFSQKIPVTQGYWAVANGQPLGGTNWCKSFSDVDKDAVLKTQTVEMMILAYDIDGNYVGCWDGEAFSTTYNANAVFSELRLYEWAKQYPDYCFRVDFRNHGNAFTPADVYADLEITSYLHNNVNAIENEMAKSNITGISNFYVDDFTNGGLLNGNLTSEKYRVAMTKIMSLPYDLTVGVNSGFRYSINRFNNGTFVDFVGWLTTEYTIPANQQFKIMIARAPWDDTSENADVSEFVENLYIKTFALKLSETVDELSETVDELSETVDELNIGGNLVTALTSGFRFIYHFGMEYVTERLDQPPVIPSQSIYDVRNAKNLGFECIEANVYRTSDGKYVVTHGVDGKLGHDFDDLDGNDAGAQNVVIAQHTLSDLQTNYRYRSSNSSYRLPITTLEEFLSECSRVGIKVMQMYNDDTSMNIGLNIMGAHRIFMYAAPRSSYAGPITNYRKFTTKAEIIADCESFGVPYIYSMGNPGAFTDEELADIAQTLHSMGYQLMTAYRTDNELNKLASLGWDYFILGNNSFREPVVINGKQINFEADGTVTWTVATL